jgi:hypothetical protein
MVCNFVVSAGSFCPFSFRVDHELRSRIVSRGPLSLLAVRDGHRSQRENHQGEFS